MDTQKRKLDTTTSSMDLMTLNNLVVSMRPIVQKVKVFVVRKITQKIKGLRKKKGTEEQVRQNNIKADGFGTEIEALKKLKIDRIAKYCLGNTKTVDIVAREKIVEDKIMTRIATHKLMTDKVDAWRKQHEDWKSLAAFLMYKNTGRRIKKKKKITTSGDDVDSDNEESSEINTLEKDNEIVVDADHSNTGCSEASGKQSEGESEELNTPSENESDGEDSDGSGSDHVEPQKSIVEKSESVGMKDNEVVGNKIKNFDKKAATDKLPMVKDAKMESPTINEKAKPLDQDFMQKDVNKMENDMIVAKIDLNALANAVDGDNTDISFLFQGSKKELPTPVDDVKQKRSKTDSFFMTESGNEISSSESDGNNDDESESDEDIYESQNSQFKWGKSQHMRRGGKMASHKPSQFEGKQNRMSKGTKPPAALKRPPKEALHPSWEASKKRRQEATGIKKFSGTKIKFDDSD